MITYVLLAVIVIFSVACFNNPALMQKYIFHPWSIYHHKEHYRFLSHAFIHGDIMHLILNSVALYSFGLALEEDLLPDLFGEKKGKLYLIILYTGGIYAASFTEFYLHRNNKNYYSLGASGAISSIVFCSIVLSPNSGISLFFFPKAPAWVMGALLLGISFFLLQRKRSGNYNDNISHESHFWGAIFGIVFILVVRPESGQEFIQQVIGN